MIVERIPVPPLRPFIKFVWASDHEETQSIRSGHRERLIPSGDMHLVYRLSDQPIRIYDSVEDQRGDTFRCGVVAGVRSRYYVKETCRPIRTVGAILQPGVSRLVFGVTAQELAGRHTSIQDLWGPGSIDLFDRMQEAGSLPKQLQIFESFLTDRIPQHGDVHPAVACALNRISDNCNIGQIVKETGFSHKHFIELFRSAVGLSPRLYSRILRFQRAVKMMQKPEISWIDVALKAEYSDQAHFNRDFREFTGISPGEYRNLCSESNHVPILF